MSQMPRQGIYLLAAHLNMDYSDLRDYEYQAGKFTQKVFAVGDCYYCPYRTKPSDEDGVFLKENWVKVEKIDFPFSESVIWRYDESCD